MTTIYIAINGDDTTGNGTAEKPYATPHRGLAASRTVVKPCRLTIKTGSYYCGKPLELCPEDNGLHICGETDAVLTGAMPLKELKWQPYDDKIWVTKVECPPFDRLFAGDAEQTLCRYPDRTAGAVPLEGSAAPQEIKERAKAYKNPAGGMVRAIHKAGWGGNSYIIDGKDSASPCGLKLRWVGDNNRGSSYGNAMVVENVFEELDAPAEWFYDRVEHKLYWYPPAGMNPNDIPVSIATATELMVVKGENEAPVSGLTIENLVFTETGRTLFPIRANSKPYEPLLRGDWCVVRSGAVYFENAEGCTVRGCAFQSLGGNGLFFSGYQKGHAIENNIFSNIGASGIQLVGESTCVRQPSFWEYELYPELPVHQTDVKEPDAAGPCGEAYPRDISLTGNHISGVGLLEKQSAGMNLSVCSRIKITHNTIHNSARSLINVNDGTFGGHEIAWNDLYDAQRETEDHGPFNSWGRDRFWSVPEYNASGQWGGKLRAYQNGGQTYDITKIDAYQTVHLHHNRFHHRADATHSWGIDLDDGSTNYEIDHNLILGIGIKLREGFDRRVHHNLLVDGQLQIHVPYWGCGDEIYENLILHCNPVATAGCTKKRFLKANIQMYRNYAYAGGKKIKTPAYMPRPEALQWNGGSLKEALPPQWATFFGEDYGQANCPCPGPDYIPTFGQMNAGGALWVSGARCTAVDEAVRSSTAAPDCRGLYIKSVLPFTAAARFGLKERDIIREADKTAVEGKVNLKHVNELTVWRGSTCIALEKK